MAKCFFGGRGRRGGKGEEFAISDPVHRQLEACGLLIKESWCVILRETTACININKHNGVNALPHICGKERGLILTFDARSKYIKKGVDQYLEIATTEVEGEK
jgi:hypothetical protein